MFPLGAVLFPNMPLRLRVFEERYLVMLSEMLKAERGEFGVVLIERGHEVGGGEHRFDVGTTAEITDLGAQEGIVGLQAQGHRRFRVVEWLADDPHPSAVVSELPELEWEPDMAAPSAARPSAWCDSRSRRPPSSSRRPGPRMSCWPTSPCRGCGSWPASRRSARWISSRCSGRSSLVELVEQLIQLTLEAAAVYGSPPPA